MPKVATISNILSSDGVGSYFLSVLSIPMPIGGESFQGAVFESIITFDTGKTAQETMQQLIDLIKTNCNASCGYTPNDADILLPAFFYGLPAVKFSATNCLNAKATGTVYTLTNTPAKIDFGTTDPVLTITEAGTYKIDWNVRTDLNGATIVATTISYKIRKTTSGGSDLDSAALKIALATGLTSTVPRTSNSFIVTLAANDVIELWGSIANTPTLGSVQAVEANIQAVKLY